MSASHRCLSALPMVFGTETEFGFSYGKVLDAAKAVSFSPEFPEIIFYLIIKSVIRKTGAFVRKPWIPWERLCLNHLSNSDINNLAKAATSRDLDDLPPRYKNSVVRNAVSIEDIFIGEIGVFLPNGSRLYIDGAHLEYSISECRNPYEIVCQEKAMERILSEVIIELQEVCGRELYLFKNNIDFKGNSYGCHENFLLRKEFFTKLYEDNEWQKAWLSFAVTQIMYTGAGEVFSEFGDTWDYQISQRADHFSRIVGFETMHNRPIINYRGEPLADDFKWGRFHVILDDSSMSEWAILLKIGTKALVLNMLQSEYFFVLNSLIWRDKVNDYLDSYKDLFINDPVRALHFISRDLTCKKPLPMSEKGFSALEIQKQWLALVRCFYSGRFYTSERWIFGVIEKWGQVLNWIEEDNPILNSTLDWRIKKRIIDGHSQKRAESGGAVSVEGLQLIDISYSDITDRGFYNRLPGINRFAASADIEKARVNSSPYTRAWLRSQLIKRFPEHITDVSWELLTFNLKVGDFETKVRLEPDPILSTRVELGWLFDESRSYEEFCRNFLTLYLGQRDIF